MFRINNFEPTAAAGYWVYEFFPEAISIDAARFWPPARIADALDLRGFSVEIDVGSDPAQMRAGDALADAERRVLSHLALLNDDAYARGLARLRDVATLPDTAVPTTRARLRVTARRTS